jgi:hypothetical protein
MIRPSTVMWLALAGVVGFGLYHLKQEVQALEDELFRLNRSILAEQESIHVLRAEWSYINQPSRLQALTLRHLDLQPTKPAQIGTVAKLPLLPGSQPANPLVATAPAMTQPPLTLTSAQAAPRSTFQGTLEPAALTSGTKPTVLR